MMDYVSKMDNVLTVGRVIGPNMLQAIFHVLLSDGKVNLNKDVKWHP